MAPNAHLHPKRRRENFTPRPLAAEMRPLLKELGIHGEKNWNKLNGVQKRML